MARRASTLTPDQQAEQERNWLAARRRAEAQAEAEAQAQFCKNHDPRIFVMERGQIMTYSRGSNAIAGLEDRNDIREFSYDEYVAWDKAEAERLAVEETARLAAKKAEAERAAAAAAKAKAARLAEAKRIVAAAAKGLE
jgi:hypothetical protein